MYAYKKGSFFIIHVLTISNHTLCFIVSHRVHVEEEVSFQPHKGRPDLDTTVPLESVIISLK